MTQRLGNINKKYNHLLKKLMNLKEINRKKLLNYRIVCQIMKQ